MFHRTSAWLLAATCAGCAAPRERLAARAGAIVVEACVLDDAQAATLAGADARAVADEVVLRCLGADAGGAIVTLDGATPDAARAQAASLAQLGYHVRFALALADPALDPSQASQRIASASWRANVAGALAPWLDSASGVELALPELVNTATADVTALVAALDGATRPARTLGLFAPPSVTQPSDLAGGAAYDLPALAPHLDRVRVMTLDFSCCGAPPGPTVDPAWAADAVALARGEVALPLWASAPLYGWDFGPSSSQPITWSDAAALADAAHAEVARAPAPHFAYAAPDGAHQVWFDDAASTRATLAAWDGSMASDVGVLYYGLGAEDPRTWTTLAEARR